MNYNLVFPHDFSRELWHELMKQSNDTFEIVPGSVENKKDPNISQFYVAFRIPENLSPEDIFSRHIRPALMSMATEILKFSNKVKVGHLNYVPSLSKMYTAGGIPVLVTVSGDQKQGYICAIRILVKRVNTVYFIFGNNYTHGYTYRITETKETALKIALELRNKIFNPICQNTIRLKEDGTGFLTGLNYRIDIMKVEIE